MLLYLTILLYLINRVIQILIPLLIAVAYFTLAERKVLASIQRRRSRGPNTLIYTITLTYFL
jgi:NADH:ubiquinone oxidoreductase subunit H